MHARVPIKATIKGGMQRPGAPYIRGIVHHMIQLVWIFTAHALEGECCEMRSLFAGEPGSVLSRVWNWPFNARIAGVRRGIGYHEKWQALEAGGQRTQGCVRSQEEGSQNCYRSHIIYPHARRIASGTWDYCIDRRAWPTRCHHGFDERRFASRGPRDLGDA